MPQVRRDEDREATPWQAHALDRRGAKEYPNGMKRVFDMDDRARLPWRFFGATRSVLARL
ncbi:hypothetical protein JMJ94_11910 [Rhodovulum visakhapatnamense]|nr:MULTISPECIES: hypothetical protein [Rhodovulum]MBL3570198.1 hypothetical protein [Rhodovulum visakhapatnamense]